MSREIKFRIRLRKIDTGKIITKIYTLHDVIGANELRGNIGYEVLSVEQFTGLHDKNGKEIYEGDILMPYFSVAWGGDECSGLGMNAGWYLQRDDFESWIEIESKCNDNGDNYEVIGNIHENPELLEAAK